MFLFYSKLFMAAAVIVTSLTFTDIKGTDIRVTKDAWYAFTLRNVTLSGTDMLPGVGVFGTGSTARVLVPMLKSEGFEVHALWGRSEEEACCLAKELGIPFHTSRSDDVLLHQDVDLVCIYIPPSMTRQIAVKALGKTPWIL